MRRIVSTLLFCSFFVTAHSSVLDEEIKEFDIHADIFVARNSVWAKDSGVRIPDVPASGTNILGDLWELVVDLFLNFKYKKSYGGIRLRFDNDMGSLGGTAGDIELIRAFMGYQFTGTSLPIINLEVGRVVRSDYLESKVMFNIDDYFDGVYFHIHQHVNKILIIESVLTGFVVDWLTDQYGWAGQFSIEHYPNRGPRFRYCYIDWEKNGTTRIFNGSGDPVGFTKDNPRFQFRISQFLLEYIWQSTPGLNLPVKVYGAYLINHAARRKLANGMTLTGNRKENNAWYAGVTIGKTTKPKTFSLDMNYQWVQAQAIPDFDSQGTGNGNPRSNVFYGPAVGDFSGLPVVVTQANANGDSNFKGWQFILNYQFTKNISARVQYQFSNVENKSIGPDRTYQEFVAFTHFYW